MKDTLVRKGFIFSVIILFIGVAVTPSINQSVVTASQDDDLVEVTTQACGIKEFGNTTVKLTREQYQNLESYLVDFRARLNQTSTKEEAVPIFKDAVVELDKYGLLPKGMSVERAQKLVISGYQNQYSVQHSKKIYDRNTLNQTEVHNKFCLIAGVANNNLFIGPVSMFGLLIRIFLFLIFFTFWAAHDYTPFEIGGFVTLGYAFRVDIDNVVFVPSDGWVYSLGLQGAQSINGSFYGAITMFPWSWNYNFYIGVTGFIGLIINSLANSDSRFFLGSAYRIGLSTNL